MDCQKPPVGALGLLTCAHCCANLRAIGTRPYRYYPHPRPAAHTLPLPAWYRAIDLAIKGKPNNLFWKESHAVAWEDWEGVHVVEWGIPPEWKKWEE